MKAFRPLTGNHRSYTLLSITSRNYFQEIVKVDGVYITLTPLLVERPQSTVSEEIKKERLSSFPFVARSGLSSNWFLAGLHFLVNMTY